MGQMNCSLQLPFDCEVTMAEHSTHRQLTFQHLQLHNLNPTAFTLTWFVTAGIICNLFPKW